MDVSDKCVQLASRAHEDSALLRSNGSDDAEVRDRVWCGAQTFRVADNDFWEPAPNT